MAGRSFSCLWFFWYFAGRRVRSIVDFWEVGKEEVFEFKVWVLDGSLRNR